MEAKREARRRRILENSENRLKRVVDAQSKARKKNDDDDDVDSNGGCTTDHTPGSSSNNVHVENDTSSGKTDAFEKNGGGNAGSSPSGNSIDTNNEITGSDETSKFDSNYQSTKNQSIFDEREGASESDAKLMKYAEKTQLVVRMMLVFGLAVLLVLVSNLKLFEKTRFAAVRQSSFLLYFCTLQFVIFCLFPLQKEVNRASAVFFIMKLFGLSESRVTLICSIFLAATRILQDFSLFSFTVIIINHFTSSL